MPLPLIPLALGLVGLFALASSKKEGTVGNPPAGQPPTPPEIKALFDDNMPYNLAQFVASKISTSQDPKELWQIAQQCYGFGYVKAASACVAACNHWRETKSLSPLSYPPLTPYPDYAQPTVIVGPPPGPPGPQPPPGLPPVTPIPPGPPPAQNTPPAPPVVKPGMVPPKPMPGTFAPPQSLPPGTVPQQTPPPKPVVYGNYPEGTHTRPDGTAGYTTQAGDVTTAMIAAKFGGTGADLMSANPNVSWSHNYAGTDLNLPASWMTQGPAKPGDRGPAPPGATSPGDAYTNPPDMNLPGSYVDSSAKLGVKLPKGARMLNGQLMYKPQTGDVSAAIIADRFGHKKDSKALVSLNPGYPWTKGNKEMKVPNAWL